MLQSNDTICAAATRPGGAIAIIRISGPDAIDAADAIFKPASGKPLKSYRPYSICYGHITDETGGILDEVIASIFKSPRSYTGEDCIEFSCHGSEYITQQIVSMLIMHGCRQAGPGEFTQRAFLSGKMDLSQAEAVADLIASSSAASHRLAMNQLKGGFSRKLSELRDRLLELTSLMELELDFSEEDVMFADRGRLDDIAREIEASLSRLSSSFKTGEALRNGIPVAIVGRTNTGKSTLLNLLLNDDRALVSDIRGTTRDSIEDTVSINGTLFRIIDTAGIRHSDDTVEQMGIERSFQKVSQADIVLYLTDCSQPETEDDPELEKELLPLCKDRILIRVHNKCDLCDGSPKSSENDIYISAKKGINTDYLKQIIADCAPTLQPDGDEVIVTNMRHYQAINRALECIVRTRKGMAEGIPTDLLSQDTRECIYHLSDILGEVTTDEVLGNIFARFCIGK